MKKLLSVALLLMLVTLCFALASCGNKVDTEEVNNNPAAAMTNAAENTASEFFDTGDGLYQTIRETLDNGSITISFDNEELCEDFTSKLGDFDATIYFDKENGKYAVNLSALYGDEEDERELLKLAAYLDKNTVVVKDEGLLNLEDSYKLNITDMINKLPDTDLGELIGIDEEIYDEYKSIAQKVKAEFDKILVGTEIDESSFINVFLKAFADASTEETVEINGESYKCVVANYSVTKENIEKAIKETLKAVGTQYDLKDIIDEYEERIEVIYEELDEANDFSATVKVFYDKSSGAIVRTVVDGKYTVTISKYVEPNNPGYDEFYDDNYDEAYAAFYDGSSQYYYYDSVKSIIIEWYENETGRKYQYSGTYEDEDVERSFNVAYNSSATEFSCTATMTDEDGDSESSYSGITKVKDGSVTTYTYIIKETRGYATRIYDSAVLSYDKSTGKITASTLDRTTGDAVYTINATVTEEDGSVKITLDSVNVKNYIEYAIGASITFTPDVEVPVITGDNDIADIDSFEDLDKIEDKFRDSAFRKLWNKIF